MSKLYHGSSEKGVKVLKPHNSTHGKYVYATPNKELAIIFSARCGDDCTYALFRNSENEPWIIVERIPEAFNTMFSNSSSIYTLDDENFKKINTNFSEVVSEVEVNTKSEEYIDNVYDKIKSLVSEGKILLYTYPNKPKEIPMDNSDLIEKQIMQEKRNNHPVTKQSFERLILFHPNLIDKINSKMDELNLNVEPYKKEDLIGLFENAVIKQSIYPKKEQYLKSIVTSISSCYPELLPSLKEKLSFLDKSKNEKILVLISKLYSIFSNIPVNLINQAKEQYLNDNRLFSEIGQEILEFAERISFIEQIISMPINQDILDTSILLIGPMGTGKSTIAEKLRQSTGLSRISLDSRDQLSKFYENRDKFKNFKNFEFYLTSSVLSSIEEPTIIDFGAGHSVYENQIMFYEMKKLISKFKNVLLLLPSANIDESLKIINERMSSRGGDGPHNVFETNEHFIKSPCNYALATDIIYTDNMTLDEITNSILSRIEIKKMGQSSPIKM